MGWNDHLDDPGDYEGHLDRLLQRGDDLRKERYSGSRWDPHPNLPIVANRAIANARRAIEDGVDLDAYADPIQSCADLDIPLSERSSERGGSRE